MSSRGKKKTTMAKLSRESRLRERRQDKAARKEARKLAPIADAVEPTDEPDPQDVNPQPGETPVVIGG
jgi:hypothetical protein